MYVNNRPGRSSKLSKIITSHFKRSIICRQMSTSNNKERAAQNYYEGSPKYNKLYPIFFIAIELPFFEFDIPFGPRKNVVIKAGWVLGLKIGVSKSFSWFFSKKKFIC